MARKRLLSNEIADVHQHIDTCKRCQTVLDEFRADSSSPGQEESTPKTPKSSPLPSKPEQLTADENPALKKSSKDPIPVELQNLQQYQVLKRIGRGGMGEVFLVKHKVTGRREALKVIHSHLLNRKDVRDRFKREIQSVAKLDHPNVVHTLSAIEEGGVLGLVMEYVPGESLAELVKRTGPIPIATACDFIRQAASGLAHAFQHQMVHRDIKPQNLLVSKENNILRLRILDFGLAKTTSATAADSDLTIDGSILGTPHFMSPEQALSPADVDIRSDIYSLGCTWFFLLSGRPPFEGDGPLAVLNAHQNRPVPAATSLRRGIPLETEQILKKMMAKLPKDRYQTPDELLRAMNTPMQASPTSNMESRGSEIADMGANLLLQHQHNGGQNSKSAVSDLFAFDPKAAVRPPRKKTLRRSNSPLMISILLPTLLLVGTMILRPEWISELRIAVTSNNGKSAGSIIDDLKPGQSRIFVDNLPGNAQILLDGSPAKFEVSRKGSGPTILTKPGTHVLLLRRQDKDILKKSIELADRQELTVVFDLPVKAGQSGQSPLPMTEPKKWNDPIDAKSLLGNATQAEPAAPLRDSHLVPEVPNPEDFVETQLARAFDILQKRDWKSWDVIVDTMRTNSDVSTSSMLRIKELVIGYDNSVRAAAKTLLAGAELTLQVNDNDEKVSIVENDITAITIRVRGRNREFEWEHLPPSLAIELLKLHDEPINVEVSALAAVGACLSNMSKSVDQRNAIEKLESCSEDLRVDQPRILRLSLLAPLPTANEVVRNNFSVQQRLVAHSSPVFRLDFLFDGRLVSSERKGELIRVKGQNKEIMNNIFIWSKNGDRQPLPDSSVFGDFVAAQNGKYCCRAGVDSKFLLFRLFSEGKSIWEVNISNEEVIEYGTPIMSFSDDSDEFLIATRRGMFQKYSLKARKPIPPVATIDNIDKSKVEFMSISHGLDYVFFGFKNGELWVIRTKDGNRIQPELNVDATAKANSTDIQPTIAAQLNQKGTQLAALCSNGTIRFYDFPTMNPLDNLKPTWNGTVSAWSSSLNGRFMAGIDTGFRISVCDLDSREIYASWTLPPEDRPTSIAIENNGKRAAVGFVSGSISVFQTNKD